MREILFRGKRLDNDEWVEGWLFKRVVHLELCHQNVVVNAIEVYDGESPLSIANYTIDPATVGQYTGLTDKNGKRIFEGDIIKHYNFSNNPESYSTGVILWNGIACHWERTDSECSERFFISAECKYEVIGNIHDNPELLNGGD